MTRSTPLSHRVYGTKESNACMLRNGSLCADWRDLVPTAILTIKLEAANWVLPGVGLIDPALTVCHAEEVVWPNGRWSQQQSHGCESQFGLNH